MAEQSRAAAGYILGAPAARGRRRPKVRVKAGSTRPSAPATDLLRRRPQRSTLNPSPPASGPTRRSWPARRWHDRLPHFRMLNPELHADLRPDHVLAPGRRTGRRALGRPDPAGPAGHRDPDGGRRPAVDEHELRGGLGRPPLHLAAAAQAVAELLALLERALAPFGARPHWGKVFAADAARSRRGTSGTATSCGSSAGSTPAAPSGTVAAERCARRAGDRGRLGSSG